MKCELCGYPESFHAGDCRENPDNPVLPKIVTISQGELDRLRTNADNWNKFDIYRDKVIVLLREMNAKLLFNGQQCLFCGAPVVKQKTDGGHVLFYDHDPVFCRMYQVMDESKTVEL